MNNDVMPVRRNLNFHLPAERISDWHSGSVHISHFLNAMSIFFPVGERFFIDSVFFHFLHPTFIIYLWIVWKSDRTNKNKKKYLFIF